MSEIKFSILIPNLGYSPLLKDCLNSIVNQIDITSLNYEIIICDQSDANDAKKIKSLIETDYSKHNINYIHSDIKSPLIARHTLMANVHGDYIVFIDSDDFIENNYLTQIDKIISEKNPDIIYIGLKQCRYNGEIYKFSRSFSSIIIDNYMDYFLYSDAMNSIVRKIFKRSLYDKKDYSKFDIINGDDKAFSLPLMQKAKTIYFASAFCPYIYRDNPNSITHSKKIKNISDSIFLNQTLDIPLPKTKMQKKIFANFLIRMIFAGGAFYSKDSKNDLKFFFRESRKYIKENNLLKFKYCNGIASIAKVALIKLKAYKLIILYYKISKSI